MVRGRAEKCRCAAKDEAEKSGGTDKRHFPERVGAALVYMGAVHVLPAAFVWKPVHVGGLLHRFRTHTAVWPPDADAGRHPDGPPLYERVRDERDSRGKNLWRQRQLMAQTCACGGGAACAGRMEHQRSRVLKNECFSGRLKPSRRFSPPTRKRYIIHKKRRVFFKPGISTGERGRDHSATCIILPLPPENPTCYSLCSKTDFPEGCSHARTFKTTEANCHADGDGQASQKRLPACYPFNAQLFTGIRQLSESSIT